MSGIVGIISSKEINLNNQLSKMIVWNRAYGSDVVLTENSDVWTMGVCYEHITNTPVCASPILHRDNLAGVIDAVIYNRSDLIKRFELSDALSDEEIIFDIATKHGFFTLSEVNGDFVGAILNTTDNELVLFRDHLGIRPLFYYCSDDFIAFSSDIRGLLALNEVPGEVSPDWIYKRICGYGVESDTNTEIQNVFMVAQASYLTITMRDGSSDCSSHKYWDIGSKKYHCKNERQYVEAMRDLIGKSVERRLDVFPDIVGSELSGGLDSGVISILIHRNKRDAIYYSWSADPEDVPYVDNDERLVIKDICDQEKIECHYESHWSLDADSNFGRNHEAIGLKYDPEKDTYTNFAIPLYVNTFPIAQTSQYISNKGGKVVFTGHGGDEGVSHRSNPFELYYHKEYQQYIKLCWDLTKGQKNRFLQTYRLAKGKASLKEYYLTRPFVYHRNAPQIVSKELKEEFSGIPMPVDTFAFDVIRYINDGCTNVRPRITAFLGAYSGARYVYPYLDKDVIDFAVSIPRYLYQKGGVSRYIFREAFKDIMPASLYEVTIKEIPSENAEKKKPVEDWFTVASKYNKELLQLLDRTYWERYLDYDVLEKWANSERPSDEEKQRYMYVTVKLRDCLRLQSMINTVKSLPYDH